MIKIDNNIYVIPQGKNKATLKFPKLYIETAAYIGRNGMTTQKEEGDGKTPIGEFELGVIMGFHTSEKNINGLKYMQITEDMYWVDDPKSRYYNQLVNMYNVEKDWDTAEHLTEYPIQYEYLIEIKTNPKNIQGKGSAIFLHCTNNKPTAGCIAVDRNIMKKIIQNINKQTKLKIGEENGNNRKR